MRLPFQLFAGKFLRSPFGLFCFSPNGLASNYQDIYLPAQSPGDRKGRDQSSRARAFFLKQRFQAGYFRTSSEIPGRQT